MGFSIQNSETGEVDYIHCDDATIERQTFDKETGEPFNDIKCRVRYVKHKRFQIPKKYLRGTLCDEFEKAMTDDYSSKIFQPHGIHVTPKRANESNATGTNDSDSRRPQYDRDDYLNMEGVKNDIILGYNKNNILLFLIPSLFFFNIYVAMVLALLEMFLHYWAHVKNGLNMNKVIYYRSPMHVLTSQFCAVCRAESEVDMSLFAMWRKQMRLNRKTSTEKHHRALMLGVSKAIS